MEQTLRAIEVTGEIDDQQQLHLDAPLPVTGPSRFHVIILITEPTDVDESEWLRNAVNNSAFDFLNEPEEDIYTLTDGKPFHK